MQNQETESIANLPQASNVNQPQVTIKSLPTPDNPPWNNWIAFGTWFASIVFLALFQNIFLIAYLAKQHVNFTNQDALLEFVKTDPTSVLILIISTIPAHVFTIVLAWLVVTKARKYPFRQTLGWEWNGFKIWHAIVIVLVFFAISAIASKIFGESENEFQKILESSRAVVFPIAFMATFTAPLVEEVIYRGILYSSLQRKLGVVYAVIIVTLMFGMVHYPQYSKDWIPDFSALIPLFLLSLTLTLIRVRTKNLLPCIIVHTFFNGVSSFFLIIEPYLKNAADQNQTQPAFFLHLFK